MRCKAAERQGGTGARGSITVFMALILSLLVGLCYAGIRSVRSAAARVQALSAVDVGLYSLFAQYDRALLDQYDIFALDASGGDGLLEMGPLYGAFEKYMNGVLTQNSQSLWAVQGGFSGYALLTDDGGEVFYRQVVRYMKDTIWAQGISLVQARLFDRAAITSSQEAVGQEARERGTLSQYEEELSDAARRSEEERARREREARAGIVLEEDFVSDHPNDRTVVNPIPVIKSIRQMGILSLVLPPTQAVSEARMGEESFPSRRQNQQGMYMSSWDQSDLGVVSDLLFQQYLLKKLSHYRRPSSLGLSYQVEYILGGKTCDRENLEEVATRLLVIREGVNAASIASDPVKMGQASSLALGIASGFLIPPAAGVIQSALVLSWAFAESILDVRELFCGGRVPLVKLPSQWQLSLENLPHLLERLDTDRRSDPMGLSYEDYLQILLLAKSRQEKTMRALDMVEQSLREQPHWANFRLDSCVVAVDVSVDILSGMDTVYTVDRMYGYQ